jgi:hypothetical protein
MSNKSIKITFTLLGLLTLMPALSACEYYGEDRHGGRHHDNGRHEGNGHRDGGGDYHDGDRHGDDTD